MCRKKMGEMTFYPKKKGKENLFFGCGEGHRERMGDCSVSQVIRACESDFFLVESSHKFVKDFTRCEKLSTPMQELGAILHSPNSTMYLLLYNLECDC